MYMRRRCISTPPPMRRTGLFAPTSVRLNSYDPTGAAEAPAGVNTRDQRASGQGVDHNGNKIMMSKVDPQMKNTYMMHNNTLEHVKVPELSEEKRQRSDFERVQDVRAKFGRRGPGEKQQKSSAQERRDMLKATQDIDGLPWELRTRKENMVSVEEHVQELRDRIDLYVQDPMEREMWWWLQWNDRQMLGTMDRMIWPQGYTDFLDRYDEHGRRRHLPNSKKYGDSSWKQLVDDNFRKRMHAASTAERKDLLHMLGPAEELTAETQKEQTDTMILAQSQIDGIVDPDQEQIYHAAAGSADKLDIEKTKNQIGEYIALQQLEGPAKAKAGEALEMDPVTGLPKAEDMSRLRSGLTVEQGLATVSKAWALNEKWGAKAEIAWASGEGNNKQTYIEESFKASRALGDTPALSAIAHEDKRRIEEAQAKLDRGETIDGPVTKFGDHLVGTIAADIHGERPKKWVPNPPLDPQLAAERGPMQEIPAPSSAPMAGAFDDVGMLDQPTASPSEDAPAAAETPEATIRPASMIDHTYTMELSSKTPAEVMSSLEGKKSGFANHDDVDEKEAKHEQPSEVSKDFDRLPTQKMEKEEDIPEWYHEAAVEVNPVIQTYGLMKDPVEQAESPEDAFNISKNKEQRLKVRFDKVPRHATTNSFDEREEFKRRATPELVKEFKPLPLFKDVVQDSIETGGSLMSSAQQREVERAANLEKVMSAYDAELQLPDLPWETDPISDPYRGVSEISIGFDKKDAETVYQRYKEAVVQGVVETQNMGAKGVDEAGCVDNLYGVMKRIRNGEVGDRPIVDERIEEVFRVLFEAHTREILQTILRDRNRLSEANTLKAEADEGIRKATAKAKQLGKSFMDFVNELSAMEMETMKENPMNRFTISCIDTKYKPCIMPYINWYRDSLKDFGRRRFTDIEGLEHTKQILMTEIDNIQSRAPKPRHLEMDKVDAANYLMTQWCKATLNMEACKHAFALYLTHLDTHLLGAAEQYSNQAEDDYKGYHKANGGFIQAPCANVETQIPYRPYEFLEGMNGCDAEIACDLEKAEKCFHTSTTKRWYPMIDETDYVLYLERRGKFNMAIEAADRSIDAMTKMTHPAIYPFPERGYKFLEGAPLTQETAEHLWLRHMGDFYFEFAAFFGRMGKYEASHTLRERAINHYHLALQLADERLPRTWSAILLTYAKYLVARAGDTDYNQYIKEVEAVVDKLYAIDSHKAHWVEPFTDCHYRYALPYFALSSWVYVIREKAEHLVNETWSDDATLDAIKFRAEKGYEDPKITRFLETSQRVQDVTFRAKMKNWIDNERQGSDVRLLMIHHYFALRMNLKTHEEVEKAYEMYKPSYDGIYLQSCLGEPWRGTKLINEATRRMSHILSQGNDGHKQQLLKYLNQIAEKLPTHFLPEELDRAIDSLEAHLADPERKRAIYIINTKALSDGSHAKYGQLQGNATLATSRSRQNDKQYEEFKKHMAQMRAINNEEFSTPMNRMANAPGESSIGEYGTTANENRGLREQVLQPSTRVDERTGSVGV